MKGKEQEKYRNIYMKKCIRQLKFSRQGWLTRSKEEYFIILKGSIPQENFKMINVCVLNRRKSIKIKQNLAMKRWYTYKYTWRLLHPSVWVEKKTVKKMCKDEKDYNYINHIELIFHL